MQSDGLESSDRRIDLEIARLREQHRGDEARENSRRAARIDSLQRSQRAADDPVRGTRVDIRA